MSSPTLGGLVSRIQNYLYGFSQVQQQFSTLNSNIAAGDQSFLVTDPTQISRGLIEINGMEQVWVEHVNQTTNTVFTTPWGRGYNSTTATSHSVGERIENNPIWPTQRITEAINDTIRGVYPDIYKVKSTQLTKLAVQYQYQLPADCQEVLSVKYQLIGPSKINPYVRRWRFDNSPVPNDLSGPGLEVLEYIVPGRQIEVVYRTQPTELAAITDDFVTVTGLPATSQDVIVYGTMMKLLPAAEGPRLILNDVQSSERGALVQPGSASRDSQYYATLYKQRLQEESRKLFDLYQQPVHLDY